MFRAFFGHPTPPNAMQMLEDIKRTCSIFLSDEHYHRLAVLPEPSLRTIWQHKEKMKDFLFHHGERFNDLMQLTPDNMQSFFDSIRSCPFFDIPEKLDAILARQQAQSAYAPPPAYYPPAPGYYPPAPYGVAHFPPIYPSAPPMMMQAPGYGYPTAPQAPGYPLPPTSEAPVMYPPRPFEPKL